MMKYISNGDYKHDAPTNTGVLLCNLGTPEAPTVDAVRRYLAEFLSDPRVIETSKIIWWPILHGFILRTRPKRSAEAYQQVWTENGSPLLDISIKQVAKISGRLSEFVRGPVHTELGMRYGKPSIVSALEKLRSANVQRLLIFPLYPQYSATTTASVFDAVTDTLKTWRWIPEVRMIDNYHDDEAYIGALAQTVRDHWAGNNKADKLLFSFHGLPKKYFHADDPYFCECQKTARLIAENLNLDGEDWQVSFQSQIGVLKWLKPYTESTLKQLGKQGVESVDILCPGFSADCLETLEEISVRNRSYFLQAGGKRFTYIPALNDQSSHIAVLTELIIKHCHGWLEFSDNWSEEKVTKKLAMSEERTLPN